MVSRSVGDVVAEVLMIRAAGQDPCIFVEGPSDSSFWQRFSPVDPGQFVTCFGKSTVIGSIRRLEALGIQAIIGIIDDDYDSILNILYQSSNLVSTDSHDLETILIESKTLEMLFNEYCDATKRGAFETSSGKTLREGLVDRALPFGKLRLISLQLGLSVAFPCSPWKYINDSSWHLDYNLLLADFATAMGLSIAAVQTHISAAPSTPEWALINGHDAVEIIAIAFCVLGKRSSPSNKLIPSILRLTYAEGMLQCTRIYAQIKAWELRNAATVLTC